MFLVKLCRRGGMPRIIVGVVPQKGARRCAERVESLVMVALVDRTLNVNPCEQVL